VRENIILFDTKKRINKECKKYSEPLFAYLERSGKKSSGFIRNLLEEWYSHYPEKHKKDIYSMLISKDDHSHLSAFFELYMHELLLKLGFTAEIHPEIEGKSTHPDFLVFLDSIPLFYLECALVKGPKKDTAAEKLENKIYDMIDEMKNDDFFLYVEINASSTSTPSGAKWRRELERRLSELDPDELYENLEREDWESLPQWTLEDKGWKVTFRPIPRSKNIRGKHCVRPIGIIWKGFFWSDIYVYIRNVIREKANKYGRLKLPYVIAVNVLSLFCDDIAISEALFGKLITKINREPDGTIRRREDRKPNGVWWGSRRPQYTRVSGVIVFPYLYYGNIAKVTPTLWHNPWARHPINLSIFPFNQRVPNKEEMRMELRMGKPINEIFSLPENWPFFEKDDDCC